jgi:hypothetical protein
LRCDLVRPRLDRDNDWIFVWFRSLQRFELAVKQASRHEMLMPSSGAAGDQLLGAVEIDETEVGTIADQNITVAAFQSEACDENAILHVKTAKTSMVWPLASQKTPRCATRGRLSKASMPLGYGWPLQRRSINVVAGDFPGSPVTLAHAFRLEGEKIATLEIG